MDETLKIPPLRDLDVFGSDDFPPDTGTFLTIWRSVRQSRQTCEWVASAIRGRPNHSIERERAWWDSVQGFVVACEEHKDMFEELRTVERVSVLIETARQLALGGSNAGTRKELAFDDALSRAFAPHRDQFVAILRRTLSGEPTIGRATTIPVAFDYKPGVICRMHLEILPGEPAVGAHPEQFIHGSFDPSELLDSINASWEAARAEVFGAREPHFCGRWQLWNWSDESVPFPKPTGDSLGAALARGWAVALAQAARKSGLEVSAPVVADPRVLTIAQVNRTPGMEKPFALAPVDSIGVYEKVRSLATLRLDDGTLPIDRVVVVGSENREAALNAIRDARLIPNVDVVMLGDASSAHATRERSPSTLSIERT